MEWVACGEMGPRGGGGAQQVKRRSTMKWGPHHTDRALLPHPDKGGRLATGFLQAGGGDDRWRGEGPVHPFNVLLCSPHMELADEVIV